MSTQCCPLTEPDGYCEFSCVTRPVARKAHECYECHRDIQPGERYHRLSGKSDGDFYSESTCAVCDEIREHFACGDGYLMGALWEDLAENFIPEMKAGGPCLEGLSAAAKERMFAEWRRWRGLRGTDDD